MLFDVKRGIKYGDHMINTENIILSERIRSCTVLIPFIGNVQNRQSCADGR
jgi:hypothetical protein